MWINFKLNFIIYIYFMRLLYNIIKNIKYRKKKRLKLGIKVHLLK